MLWLRLFFLVRRMARDGILKGRIVLNLVLFLIGEQVRGCLAYPFFFIYIVLSYLAFELKVR